MTGEAKLYTHVFCLPAHEPERVHRVTAEDPDDEGRHGTHVLSQASDNIPSATAYHMSELHNLNQKEGRSKNMSPLIFLTWNTNLRFLPLISSHLIETNLIRFYVSNVFIAPKPKAPFQGK